MDVVRPPGPYTTPRRYPRYQFDAHLAIRMSSAPHRVLRGRTLDLSACGLSAFIAGELGIGATVEVEFALDGQEFRVRAIVRNQWGVRYGFEFLTLSAEQRRRIEAKTKELEEVEE